MLVAGKAGMGPWGRWHHLKVQKDPDGQQWVTPVDPKLRLTSFLTDSERGHSPGVPAASCVCRGRFLPWTSACALLQDTPRGHSCTLSPRVTPEGWPQPHLHQRGLRTVLKT